MLDKSFEIDTYLGLLSSTFCKINDFTSIFRNAKGEVVFSKDEKIDGRSPQFLNLQDYALGGTASGSIGTFRPRARKRIEGGASARHQHRWIQA